MLELLHVLKDLPVAEGAEGPDGAQVEVVLEVAVDRRDSSRKPALDTGHDRFSAGNQR